MSEERLRRKIRDRRLVVADRDSENALEREEQLLLTLSRLETAIAESARPAAQAMGLVYLGVLVNFGFLIWSSLDPNFEINVAKATGLLIVSITPYTVALTWLSFLAASKIDSLESGIE